MADVANVLRQVWPILVALTGLTYTVGYLLAREKNDRRYAKREEVEKAEKHREALQSLYVQLDDRLGVLENNYEVQKQTTGLQQQHLLEKISELASSMAKVAESVKSVSDIQSRHAGWLDQLIRQNGRGKLNDES